MSTTTGVTMLRVLGVAAMAATISIATKHEARRGDAAPADQGPALDVSALLAAANGASPIICSLAAQSVRNYGGDWNDAPATPLAVVRARPVSIRDGSEGKLPDEDVDRLIAALASPDACVREISVRLLGSQRRNDRVANALVERLKAADAPMREVAAYGLGMVQPPAAVEPLIAALRDASAGVRGNAAWALGRMDAGRAFQPLLGLFGDGDARVREAAVVAVGHLDSTSAVEALTRVLEHDDVASVRRVAAWALGQRELRGAAVTALANALGHDSDARVREMSAWALGNGRERAAAVPALATALRGDADDGVRETAAWALGELGDRSALDALGKAVESDRSARVRGTAAWAIGNLRGRGGPVPPGLLGALKDDMDDVRLKAAWALGEVGDASAVAPIRDALGRETTTSVRRALVRALVKSGGRSEENMAELLKSGDAGVREAAIRGLVGHDAFNPWPWPQPRPRPFP